VELGGDPVLAALRSREASLSVADLRTLTGLGTREVLRRLEHLGSDFELVTESAAAGPLYRLGEFKAFTGQADHSRHERFAASRSKVSLRRTGYRFGWREARPELRPTRPESPEGRRVVPVRCGRTASRA
jgi:hypothetical protein